jgi:serine/threonine protein phosphatase PrpC
MSAAQDETGHIAQCPWAAGGSEIGQERADNEDAWFCDPVRGLFIVADGMGGHAAGEEASAAAIQALSTALSQARLRQAVAAGAEAMQGLLHAALTAANAAILQLEAAHPEWVGMGTTAVIAVRADADLYVANVGDSRAYLLRGGRATPLTCDHSVAAMLVNSGTIAPDELRLHPMRNQLTMVLGSTDPLLPAFTVQSLRPGDRVVLCSDGLWDMLDDDTILQIVQFSATPCEAAYALISAADDAGGLDNITVIVMNC